MSAKKINEKIFWSEFLELYETMPTLWKVKSDDYCNRDKKNFCYEKMVEKLKEIDEEATREKVVKKINIFRTNYKRDLKKIKQSEKSGAGADEVFTSSLWYFDKMHFLYTKECLAEGKSSMDSEDLDNSIEVEKEGSRKRKGTEEENLLKLACQKLARCDTGTSVLAKGWASQYDDLTKDQQIYARTIFSDVLFHGCMTKLSAKVVEDMHQVLGGASVVASTSNISRSSTPLTTEYYVHSDPSCSSTSTPILAESVFSPSLESTRVYFQPVTHNMPTNFTPTIVTQPVSPTETMQSTQSIAQYLHDFLDE